MNRKEEHNSEIFLRPRFSIDCHRQSNDVLKTIQRNLENHKSNHVTKVSDNHFFIDVPTNEAHFWSPQLHFRIEQDNNHTKIKGLFGPKPQVWTLFMFIHFIIATTFIGFAILFYTRNKLGGNVIFPVIMMVVLPLVWFTLYLLGSLGKERGKKQMNNLKELMKDILENV